MVSEISLLCSQLDINLVKRHDSIHATYGCKGSVESYQCKKFRFGNGNGEFLKETLENGISMLTTEIHHLAWI